MAALGCISLREKRCHGLRISARDSVNHRVRKQFVEAAEKLRTPGGGALGGVRGVDGERGGSAVVMAKVAQKESSRTRLLHLVNFKFEQPLKDVAVRIRIPGMRVREVVKTPDEGAGRRGEFSV